MQFHLLSLEGPDEYSRVGGLATRVEGLADALVCLGYEPHLWYVGAPDRAGEELRGGIHLHRWCQWLSTLHPNGVYDGDAAKAADYGRSLPPRLVERHLLPAVFRRERAIVLAEEWQTVGAVLHLERLLRMHGIRSQVSVLWNANNIFGFEGIAWDELARAATITTVSRYMKHRMREWGADALVIPNGLSPDCYESPPRAAVRDLRHCFKRRTVIAKMARWDPDKRWVETIRITAEMKRRGWRPLLIARGGRESHGREVLQAAWDLRLRVEGRSVARPGSAGLVDALRDVDDADVIDLQDFVDPGARRLLFRGADAVLANSSHEPFGLVGLEAMAAGGLACTGCSGEDYAVPGQNALVLETSDPSEFLGLFQRLREQPDEARALRRSGRATARRYAWPSIVERVLMPRVEANCGEPPLARQMHAIEERFPSGSTGRDEPREEETWSRSASSRRMTTVRSRSNAKRRTLPLPSWPAMPTVGS